MPVDAGRMAVINESSIVTRQDRAKLRERVLGTDKDVRAGYRRLAEVLADGVPECLRNTELNGAARSNAVLRWPYHAEDRHHIDPILSIIGARWSTRLGKLTERQLDLLVDVLLDERPFLKQREERDEVGNNISQAA